MQQEPSPWGLSLYKMCEFSDSQESADRKRGRLKDIEIPGHT